MEYSIISIQNEDPLHCIQMEGPLTRNGACSPLSCTCVHSHVWLFATPETVARQAPLSMGFSRQEYWSGLPFTSPGDLSNPGIEPASLASPALAGRCFTTAQPGKYWLLNANYLFKYLQIHIWAQQNMLLVIFRLLHVCLGFQYR